MRDIHSHQEVQILIDEMDGLRQVISIPNLGIRIPRLGIYKPKFGIHVPRFGIEMAYPNSAG